METAARPVPVQTDIADANAFLANTVDSSRALAVVATYALTEAGRKVSLLSGGNGRTVQQVQVQVPANRLHLVTVNGKGVARLKLRPHYELKADQRLVCVDALPAYDAPPTTDDLLREAARNHQLERAYLAERTAAKMKRSDTDRARRTEVAAAFLADPSQRALVHPAPSPERCFVSTPYGRMRFDTGADDGPARQVPREALRRFRADIRAARERRERERAEHLRKHEARRVAVAEWIETHGSADQRARQAAGVLPTSEVVEAIADTAFGALSEYKRYERNGASQILPHVQQWTGKPDAIVNPADVLVFGHPAHIATKAQWARLQAVEAAVPDASVTLHVREFIWRCDARVPRLRQFTMIVTKTHGPFTLRREYILPDENGSSDSDAR
jgi:hypothetical protein